MAIGPETLVPVRKGRYRRMTSVGGADALTTRFGSLSLAGGNGRTCAARRSRIGMPVLSHH